MLVSSVATKKKGARTERRKAERAHTKRLRDAQALAKFEPGGSAERPIEVATAAVLEVQATSFACLGCGQNRLRIKEHAAREIADQRLRLIDVKCGVCGLERRFYFRIGGPLAN
jgi:hypothetical protein